MNDEPKRPVQATIFTYQVGFGDCILIRITYSDGHLVHILNDFGTTGLPEDAERERLVRIAEDIRTKTGGKLDIVIATHRHADHISGFATKSNGKGPGDIIRTLKPDIVIQPWTEAPNAAVKALESDINDQPKSMRSRLKSLNAMQIVAASVVQKLDNGGFKHLPKKLADEISFVGKDNIANLSAVKNLMTMGKKNVYAYHGCETGLGNLLPGIKVHVLGPPTLKQSETIRKQRSRDVDQFWHLTEDRLGRGMESQSLFPGYATRPANKLPTEVRWLAQRLDKAQGEQLLGIVRALDKQLNNTSLILLFETEGKKLLFPGDAQIENWNYALASPMAALLDGVDLYKVGHHGSLNATPKAMWNRFGKKGGKSKPNRLTSVLSTMPGKHGHEEDHTEVPRQTLLKELQDNSDLHATHVMDPGVLCDIIEMAL
jgi:hypothetical protein